MLKFLFDDKLDHCRANYDYHITSDANFWLTDVTSIIPASEDPNPKKKFLCRDAKLAPEVTEVVDLTPK